MVSPLRTHEVTHISFKCVPLCPCALCFLCSSKVSLCFTGRPPTGHTPISVPLMKATKLTGLVGIIFFPLTTSKGQIHPRERWTDTSLKKKHFCAYKVNKHRLVKY